MHDLDDVLRSVRRYLAATLGEPWVIYLARSDVADDDRPAALIDAGDLRAPAGRATLHQGPVEHTLPLTVTCWPSPAPETWAAHTARGLASQLNALVVHGLDLGQDANGRPVAGPYRIPLYDYSDVPVIGGTPGPADPYDRLWVDSHSTRAFQDPGDPRRWNVVLELTLSWETPGRLGPEADAPITAAMPVTYRGRVNP